MECSEAGVLRVFTQATLIGQALDNLIDNALKYGPPGTPVRVSLSESSGMAAIAVRDGGPGIAPADSAHVFEPFLRSEDARRRGVAGLGLGLAVVARIVKALEGRIELRSVDGRGCEFAILLPLQVVDSSAVILSKNRLWTTQG